MKSLLALALAAALAAPAGAQIPVNPPVKAATPRPTLNTEFAQSLLPAAPDVADWQPRNRAVAGGKIVITGTGFRPQDFEAVVGASKYKLPVRVGSSTPTRIELDVPADALGVSGAFLVAHHGTQARTLDTTYRLDQPTPALAEMGAGSAVFPYVKKSVHVKVREFPGAKLDVDAVTFGGTCGFHKQPGISYGTPNRAQDLSLEFTVQGWFGQAGTCRLEVRFNPLAADGSSLSRVTLDGELRIEAPVTYSFSSTDDLKSRFGTTLVHFGLGSICTGTLPNGAKVGVDDDGADFSVVIRGGPLEVGCSFRTKEWILPEGVRLKEIEWDSKRTGNRCGLEGTFTSMQFSPGPLSRGALTVKPDASPSVSDHVVFSDKELVFDGQSFKSNLSRPTTMIKPLYLGMQCVSMATVLTNSSGTHGPTLDPQAYRITLKKLVLEGPPNLTLP
ncbi:MAG: hypothetical protein NEA02_04115 [Thermoanaerobaculia bacterium]|nr:hypothetical protein [Thermoanaerobaculia bacterium]